MRFILILFLVTSFNSFATSVSEFHFDSYQKTQKTHKINLKNLEIVQPEKKFTVEQFNKDNNFIFFLGIQRDSFEKEEGIFLENLNTSAFLNWIQLFNNNIGYELEAGLSRNAIVPKSNFLFSTGFNKNFNFIAITQVGSKIALVKQRDSGYFFYNIGLGFIYKIKDYRFDFRYLKTPSLMTEHGFELRVLKRLSNKSEAGFFISQENYYPQKIEYERQGQDTFKLGLLYGF